MAAITILALSICFQALAAVLALRLIRPSRGRIAWVLISLSFVLRASRLFYEFALFIRADVDYPLILMDQGIGLLTSVLSAAGVWLISPLFEAYRRSEEARELYSHSISHDLRAPLTVIQGYAELLLDHLRNFNEEESRQGLEAIRHSSHRMNVLVQDLVDMARWSGDRIALSIEPVDLGHFLPDFLERALLASERERLRVEAPTELRPVAADPERLERILGNLISNALKYSPNTAPVLLRIVPGEHRTIISVHDAGPGIAPQDLPHIFERFYRGSRNKGGVGLGLFISRVLVEAHGGEMWVESSGRGSAFFFSLPTAP